MTLAELTEAIQEWSRARQIIPNSTPEMQWLKGLSEIGELADAIAKGDRAEVIDAIGDIFVCFVNVCALRDDMPTLHEALARAQSLTGYTSAPTFVSELLVEWSDIYNETPGDLHRAVVNILASLAEMYATSLNACVYAAYTQIKDRKGTLLPSGVFVKEE